MFSDQTQSKNILTVSKLNRLARSVLEDKIGQIWLSAEISNFVSASSVHWYFTLKDDRAQVKGAMFKGANRKVQLKPKEGDKVLVKANISLYEPRGDYQIIVEHMEPEGEGQLKQQFEILKRRLASEGIFSQEYKKTIPVTVSKVGIITSPTGAALHDILTVLRRRNPAIEVVIYPSQVQGDNAVSLICAAITQANIRNEVDVLIVDRAATQANMDIIVATLNGVFMCKLYDRKKQCLLSGSDIYKSYQLQDGDEFLEEGIVIRSVRNHRQSAKMARCLR